MAKRSMARVWRIGLALAALLGGCALLAPSTSPVESPHWRMLPHGTLIQAPGR